MSVLLLFSANISHAADPGVIMVRVVKVTPEWIPFWNTNAWTKAVPIKESNQLKYFEVAYWEETKSIHFYEFDDHYDPRYCGRVNVGTAGHSKAECIAYREQYALLTKQIDSNIELYRSYAILNAFNEFTTLISQRYPNAEHALSYSGHGGPGGKLFHGMVQPDHVQALLRHWSEALNKKLAFIDMGGPCNKGSFGDLNAFCPFTDYYIASDLQNGGYTTHYDDSFTLHDANIERQYHRLFSENNTLVDALKARIDIKQEHYNHSLESFSALKAQGRQTYQQANYLYSCEKFKTFYDALQQIDIPLSSGDLKQYFLDNITNAQFYMNKYDDIFIHKADNRALISWEFEANGMMNSSDRRLKYPIMDFDNNNIEPAVGVLIAPHLLPDADMDKDGIVNKNDDDVDGDGLLNYGDYSELWFGRDMFVLETLLLGQSADDNWIQKTLLQQYNPSLSIDVRNNLLEFSVADEPNKTSVKVLNPGSLTKLDKYGNTSIRYQNHKVLSLHIGSNAESSAKLNGVDLFNKPLPKGSKIEVKDDQVSWEIRMDESLEF